MAWTDPTTHVYVVGEVLTAATLNTFAEANLAFLYGDTAWTVPTFANGWLDFGNVPVGFRKVGTRVVCRGTIKSGTINAVAFTFPAGYRPLGTLVFPTMSNSALGYLVLNSAGILTPTTPISNVNVGLDVVAFDTV